MTMKSSAGAAVLLFALALPVPAAALDLFCKPADLQSVCTMVPRDGNGDPAYNHTDPSRPWVIGKTDVVSLAAGDYAPGNGAVGAPMVFVIEDGGLAVEDLPAGDEVSIGAWIILCDRASFRVRNSTFRSAAQFPFQYPLLATGQSTVTFTEARLATIERSLAAKGVIGALLHVMGNDSQITVTPLTDKGITFEHTGEAWEFAVVHNATAHVSKADVFGEFYIAGTATLTVEDSQYFDLFFEACPGTPLTIPSLPGLCSIAGGPNQCITAGHQPIDFALGPSDTTFSLSFTNDKIFSWAASTYPESTLTVGAAPKDANFCVGLSMTGDHRLKLNPGNPPVQEGLDDRSLAFNGTHVFGWHVWPYGSGTVEILPDSEVGDFSAVDQVQGIARGVTFANGMLITQAQGSLFIDNCFVNERFQNIGAPARAVRTQFKSNFSVAGPIWLADTPLPALQLRDIRPEAKIHEVEIKFPIDGDSVYTQFTVGGFVRAKDGNGNTLDPFPTASVEVVNKATGTQVYRYDITSSADTGTSWDFDMGQAPYGTYEARLYFNDPAGKDAVSRRTLHYIPPVTDAGIDDAASAQDTGPDAGATDAAMPFDIGFDAGLVPDAGKEADASADLSDGASAKSEASEGSGGGCSCAIMRM